jgi:hypothetical protein
MGGEKLANEEDGQKLILQRSIRKKKEACMLETKYIIVKSENISSQFSGVSLLPKTNRSRVDNSRPREHVLNSAVLNRAKNVASIGKRGTDTTRYLPRERLVKA